ncbi:MAG: hypothetical protein AAGA27_00075 [Pseudomonadota bacterium]
MKITMLTFLFVISSIFFRIANANSSPLNNGTLYVKNIPLDANISEVCFQANGSNNVIYKCADNLPDEDNNGNTGKATFSGNNEIDFGDSSGMVIYSLSVNGYPSSDLPGNMMCVFYGISKEYGSSDWQNCMALFNPKNFNYYNCGFEQASANSTSFTLKLYDSDGQSTTNSSICTAYQI